jgi:imidazolonepropionase-like amidohydrolase
MIGRCDMNSSRNLEFAYAMRTCCLVLLCVLVACAETTVDLAIDNVDVLDVRAGVVLEDRLVLVDDGMIREIRDAPGSRFKARRTIDADGRLLVPGFIDVHHHTEYILGDSVTPGGGLIAHLSMHPDSIAVYREAFADQYLPFGVTTVRDAGSPERDMPMLLIWMDPAPTAPDFFAVGGALVTHEEGRTPFPGHSVVMDSADAANKVRELYGEGIRHVKLYWRLREPEFQAALAEARILGMNVTGHVDYQVLDLGTAIDLGLRSFEHAYTVGVGAMTEEEFVEAWRAARRLLDGRQEGLFYVGVMEFFNFLGPENAEMLQLIDRLAETGSTVTPTLHLFAQRFGLTYFATPSIAGFDRTDDLSPRQRERAIAGYRILAGYVRQMYERGIRLTVGTDWLDPGKAVLSEMLLLHELGIPMADVIRIATLNGAEALQVESAVGSVEVGKRANLVLLSGNTLEEPENILAEKVVIKDGQIWKGGS